MMGLALDEEAMTVLATRNDDKILPFQPSKTIIL
jgi:hypothetical protein